MVYTLFGTRPSSKVKSNRPQLASICPNKHRLSLFITYFKCANAENCRRPYIAMLSPTSGDCATCAGNRSRPASRRSTTLYLWRAEVRTPARICTPCVRTATREKRARRPECAEAVRAPCCAGCAAQSFRRILCIAVRANIGINKCKYSFICHLCSLQIVIVTTSVSFFNTNAKAPFNSACNACVHSGGHVKRRTRGPDCWPASIRSRRLRTIPRMTAAY